MRRVRASLQTKILAVVLASVGIPLLAMGGYLLQRNSEILREKVRETLSNQLFRRASEVDDWTRQRLGDASRWSASFVVFEGVESLARGGGDTARARRDLKQYLDSVFRHYRVYESLFVTDLQGAVLASTREEQLESWARELLASTGSARPGLVSPLRRSEHLGRPTLVVLHAIRSPNDRTVGYFVARLELSELKKFLLMPSTDPAPSFWLLDDAGRVLIKAGVISEAPGEKTFPAALPGVEAGTEPVLEATLRGLGPTVYGVRRLQGPTGGFLAATVPAPTAYRVLADSRRRLLRIGLPVVAIVCLMSFLLARSMLRPIGFLSDGARRLSAGDMDVSLPERGSDELAELTRAFNEMARKVREAHHRLETLAITDALTGLYNRRHFQDTLDRELRRAKRESQPLSLLFLDLDHFKQYNDRWGHSEGDAALQRVASEIVKTLRVSDMTFRYGGEEIAVLLPACAKDQAVEVAEKVRRAVNAGGGADRSDKGITISIGVATGPEDSDSPAELVNLADAALYEAKARGRDRVVRAGAEPTAAGRKSARPRKGAS